MHERHEERTWLERRTWHEERMWLERRTWLEKRTWLERRKAVVLRVDALKGSRDFLSFFSFGFMCKCVWEAPVGDTVEPFKCCRVFAYPDIFFLCIVSCCCTLIAYYMCD